MNEPALKFENNNVIEITPQRSIFAILKRMLAPKVGIKYMSEEQINSYRKYIDQEIVRFLFNIRKNKTKDEKFNEVKIEDYELPPLVFSNQIKAHIVLAYGEYEQQKIRSDEKIKLY